MMLGCWYFKLVSQDVWLDAKNDISHNSLCSEDTSETLRFGQYFDNSDFWAHFGLSPPVA